MFTVPGNLRGISYSKSVIFPVCQLTSPLVVHIFNTAFSAHCAKPITGHIAPPCFSNIFRQHCFLSLIKTCQILPQLSQYCLPISHMIEPHKCYKKVWYRNGFSFLEEIPTDSQTTHRATFTFLFYFNEVSMPKGHKYNGEEATQKLLDMSTDSNMESEPDEYMDCILHREGVKRVYSQKHGHTESSVTDKDKASDGSLEFQDDVLQLLPQCSLQDLCSTNKHLHSGSPVPSTSTSKPAL